MMAGISAELMGKNQSNVEPACAISLAFSVSEQVGSPESTVSRGVKSSQRDSGDSIQCGIHIFPHSTDAPSHTVSNQPAS